MLPAISPQEAFERFSKDEARLVDIRETDEYTQEFVPGSRLIPLSIIILPPTAPTKQTTEPTERSILPPVRIQNSMPVARMNT